MNENITVLNDESLGGIEREYREVKRKAAVGERIKIVSADNTGGAYFDGDVFTVDDYAGGYDDTGHVVVESIANSGNYDGQIDAWEYVVLEPTDIIRLVSEGHIDNERLRMIDRKAAVGERVIITNWLADRHVDGSAYKNGDVANVINDRVFVQIPHNDRIGYVALLESEYVVLEPVESAKSAAPTAQILSAQPPLDQAAANISALTAKVQALESRVAALEKANQPVKVAEGPADDTPPSFAGMPRAKSLQQIRDEIVERAKADVKALETTRIDNVPLRNGWTATFNLCPGQDFVRFEINLNKRTVVALLLTRDGHVWARGIAKAAPNDVFNAHIGRAISLYRALGLEVPAEYLNVPNPEEPRVGDVIIGTISGVKAVVHRVGNEDAPGNRSGWVYGQYEDGDALSTPDFKIIDDSREEVGV